MLLVSRKVLLILVFISYCHISCMCFRALFYRLTLLSANNFSHERLNMFVHFGLAIMMSGIHFILYFVADAVVRLQNKATP